MIRIDGKKVDTVRIIVDSQFDKTTNNFRNSRWSVEVGYATSSLGVDPDDWHPVQLFDNEPDAESLRNKIQEMIDESENDAL